MLTHTWGGANSKQGYGPRGGADGVPAIGDRESSFGCTSRSASRRKTSPNSNSGAVLNSWVTPFVCAAFVLIALWHFRMAFSPSSGESAAVPSVDGKPLFVPSRKSTIAVGVVLLLFAAWSPRPADCCRPGCRQCGCRCVAACWRWACWRVRSAISDTWGCSRKCAAHRSRTWIHGFIHHFACCWPSASPWWRFERN